MLRKLFLSRPHSRTLMAFNKASEMDNYVWIDMEMTGLDVKIHTILEIACLITTTDLKLVHAGLHIEIHQPDEVLQLMSDWARVQHTQSGLTSNCKKSKISITEADIMTADYIKTHANLGGVRYLAGNSVYMDKFFLDKYMPTTSSLLHYRLVDVSSLEILCSHWYPVENSKMPLKKKKHRALDDILESIASLKALRKAVFKGCGSAS